MKHNRMVKFRRIIMCINIVLLLLGFSFFAFHDCTKYVQYNAAIVMNEDGTFRSSGFCIICNRYMAFENGKVIQN